MQMRVLAAVTLPVCGALLALGLSAAGADTLILADGSKVEGTIIEESGDTVVLKVKFGQVPYKKAEIKDILRAGSSGPVADAAELRDVLVLKNGEQHRGLLVSEDDKEITFDLVMSGKNVSKTLLSRTAFERGEVQEVKKLSDSQRAAARKHIEDAQSQTVKDAAAEQNVKIETATWTSKDGKQSVQVKKIELEHFEIASDANEDFLRRAAFRLGKVFAAYKQHFGADRNQSKKVRVLILNSMAEYKAFVGGQIENPAFYSPDAKLIAAGCDVALYEKQIAEVKKEHAALNVQLEEWKRKLADARAQVAAYVAKVYEQAKRSGAAGKAGLDDIKAQQTEWQLKAGQVEKVVNGIQDKIAELNRRNDVLFNEYTQEMFATLYHEGFHAFLDNFLFPEGESKNVPRWLNEGLAQYFECARMENDRFILGQEDRAKMAFLRKCKKEGGLVPLDKVVSGQSEDYLMRKMSDLEHSTKHYLEAWSLVHMLGEKGRLTKDLMREYVKQVADKKDSMEALAQFSGLGQPELQAAWEAKLKQSFDK